MEREHAIWVDPGRLGGEPCFTGTRVPLAALFDTLAAGDGVVVFLDNFPGPTPEQVADVLALSGQVLSAWVRARAERPRDLAGR